MTETELANLLPEFIRNSETYSLVITDLAGRCTYINEVFKKRFSFLSIDFIGQPFSVAIHPEDVEKCNTAAYGCTVNPSKIFKAEVRKPDTWQGDCYWMHWEFSLLKDQHQQALGILCLGHDIKETKKTFGVKEFAHKAETIIETITDGFFMLDDKWEFVIVNKTAEQILGIAREQLFGRKFWDVFPVLSDYNYPKAFRKAMTENVTVTVEDYRADLDRWFGVVCYPSQEGLTIFFKDITQEKKTQERLKFSEIKLRAILNSTTDGNILISPDYKILSFNKQAEKMSQVAFGKPLKELADLWDYILPKDKDDFYTNTQKALKGEYLKFEREISFEKLKKWFELRHYPVYDSDGKVLGFTFNYTDIDQRKRKEITLQESKNRIEKILEAIPHPLVIVNEKRSIKYVNDNFEKVFGYAAQEVLDKTIDFLIPERYRDKHRQHENRYLRTGGKLLRTPSENVSAITSSNQEISVATSLNTFTVEGEKFTLVILENVTEFKKRQDTILRQNETLQQIAWQQSHKVRRPVSTILGLINVIQTNKTLRPEENDQFLNYLFQTTQELDMVIHEIVAQINENE